MKVMTTDYQNFEMCHFISLLVDRYALMEVCNIKLIFFYNVITAKIGESIK